MKLHSCVHAVNIRRFGWGERGGGKKDPEWRRIRGVERGSEAIAFTKAASEERCFRNAQARTILRWH